MKYLVWLVTVYAYHVQVKAHKGPVRYSAMLEAAKKVNKKAKAAAADEDEDMLNENEVAINSSFYVALKYKFYLLYVLLLNK